MTRPHSSFLAGSLGVSPGKTFRRPTGACAGRFFVTAISISVLAGCGRQSETDRLKAELEKLKGLQEKQTLEKQLSAIQECTVLGSVFLATPGGVTLKLAGVPVMIFDEVEIKKHLTARSADLARQIEERQSAVNARQQVFEAAATQFDTYWDVYKQTLEQFARARKNLEAHAVIDERAQRVEMRYDGDLGAYETAALTFVRAAAKLKTATGLLLPHYQKVQETYKEAVAARNALDAFAAGYVGALLEGATPLRNLKSDADGRFTVRLPRGKTFVVTAETKRTIEGKTQTYVWFEKVSIAADRDELTLLLSNDNVRESVPDYPSPPPAATSGELAQPPALDFPPSPDAWRLEPPVDVDAPPKQKPAPEVKRPDKVIREGNLLYIGRSVSAEVLDSEGNVSGLRNLDAGTEVGIQKEDDRSLYFEIDGVSMRLRKTSLD